MARFNLLKGTIEGSMGKITGARWKRTYVMKSKIDGRKDGGPKQHAAVRAFEILNRLSASLARDTWPLWSLRDPSMTKHNTIAHTLGAMVGDNKFTLATIQQIIPADETLEITGLTIDYSDYTVHITGKCDAQAHPAAENRLYLLICYTQGSFAWSRLDYPDNFDQKITLDAPVTPTVFALALLFTLKNGHWKPRISAIQEDSGMEYSLTEQKTPDLWLDGKPIYQISYTGATTKGGQQITVATLPENTDTVIDISGTLKDAAGQYPVEFVNPANASMAAAAWTNETSVLMQPGTNWYSTGANYSVTMWYTKTTDIARRRITTPAAAEKA